MNNNQPQPLAATLQTIPLFYKFTAACLLITGVFSLFTNIFTIVFANFPYYTLFYVNLWRLLTSFFVADGIMTAIMSIIVLWFVHPLLERNISTIMIIIDVLVNNAAIQLVYTLIWILIYLVNQQYSLQMRSNGIWGVWIVILTRICESDPEGNIKLCCLPTMIKKRYYPLTMIVIMNMLIGYILGLIQCKFLNGVLIRLNYQQYQSLEDSVLFKCIKNRSDFKKLSEAQFSQSFCRQSQSTYTQFYSNFVSRRQQTQSNINNYNVTDNVGSTNFNNMQGGIAIGESKQVPNSDAIRNYMIDSQSPSSSKAPTTTEGNGYNVFQDQK